MAQLWLIEELIVSESSLDLLEISSDKKRVTERARKGPQAASSRRALLR